jgi:hypothetical protein
MIPKFKTSDLLFIVSFCIFYHPLLGEDPFICKKGYYCPTLSSTVPKSSIPCSVGPTQYCPEGSIRPQYTAEGYYALSIIEPISFEEV